MWKVKMKRNLVIAITAAVVFTSLPSMALADWPMAGANPQRTSWVSEEVRGQLYPQWYRPFDAFINMKTQIIAVNGVLYISTARGLYALDAVNGDVEWVYPTEMPLGNAPTIVNGVAYVGSYDRTIHAINATTGQDVAGWTRYEAQAGFETNPLVVNGVVYAGNRDGKFYAFNATTGALQWSYPTDGPILFSAAYNNGVIYFASNDAHAYALNTSGGLVWKSAKLPGSGFHSWWPVIYQNKVIFGGGHNYSYDQDLRFPNSLGWTGQELYDVYVTNSIPYGQLVGPRGTEPGDWVSGTPTCDASYITEYFESKPWRRTYFILDAATGAEYTFDSDNDSNPEYAPFLWAGDHSGTSYPSIIGSDGVLYKQVNCISDQWIARCIIAGWKFGTKYISLAQSDPTATDEIIAYAGGGNVIYWKQHYDLEGGSFDITMPNTTFPEYGWSREWKHFDYNLWNTCPGYDVKHPAWHTFGATDGVYRRNGNQCPLIPYNGKVYFQGSNCIIAFGTTQVTPTQLSMAQITAVQDSPTPFTTEELQAKLAAEVQKMVDAGHLRPGWHGSGLHDGTTGTYMTHYFYCPSETLYTLVRALPHLPSQLAQDTRTYLQQEFTNYPPYSIAHIGWDTGAAREAFDTVPEIQAQMNNFGPKTWIWAEYPGTGMYWTFPQYAFYGMWKYAQEFGGASTIYAGCSGKLQTAPSDTFLSNYPHIHNAFIAGYIGYLELQQMATGSKDPAIQTELNRLMSLRVSNFSKDSPFANGEDVQVLNVARNFIYLVPELANYLHDNKLSAVQGAVDEYNDIAAGWFVSKYDVSFLEGCLQELYDYPSIFQAKAMILKESREELCKYLDVPAFARGDLFYIQNLICAIEAAPTEDYTAPTPNPSTWATTPHATGSTSISMTATTASDPSGVQYYFDCTAGAGGHDSAWQTSSTYQDTGLSPSTQYSYRVQTRDQSANHNTGGWSTTQSATTDASDTTPPTPNPSTWATVPYATGSTTISMTATTASDPSGVQYFFDCTAGAGGHDSGWQSGATYQDTGLTPSTQYSYRVQTRDQSANQNTGQWSTTQSATTQAAPDTTPPTPNPSTWATVPYATGSTSISMTATTASDPSGVQYYFDCTAGAGGHDSAWQSSATYQDTGLNPSTQYSYRVQTRDQSANQNTGQWSTTQSATTEAGGLTPLPVFDSGAFYTPWYGTTGTGTIPFSLAATPDGQSTPAAWAQRDDAGWTEIRASGQANIGGRTYLEFDCYWNTDARPGTAMAAMHIEVNGDGGWTFKWEGTSVCWVNGNQQTFSPIPTFAAKTWQHFKLDLTTNVQGGSWPTNPNIGVIRIYQDNAGGSSLYLNNVEFTGGTPPDTEVPTPDPLTWAALPHATGTTSISMTATTASDPSGVEYYFDCTAGAGHDSGWQDSTTYADTGLSPSTQYTYRVQARDKSANQNTGAWSTSESATTDTPPDTTAPTPNPLTWATVPYSTGTTSIAMVATTASDSSGVEYYFDCTAGAGGHDSAWQSSATYQDTGLSPSTLYTYRVQARDKSANQNTGAWSTALAATTDTPTSTELLSDGFETNFDKWTDGGATDWDRATDQKRTGSYSAHAGSSDNDLISDNLNTTSYSSITIDFWFRDDDIDDSDDIYLQLYNGSTYVNRYELGNSTEDTWNHAVVTINNSGGDAAYFISNFRINFAGASIDSGENLWIDDLLITAQGAAIDPDLVAQWKFDDGSGSTAADSSDNGNTATLRGDPLWVTGRLGGGLEFDIDDDAIVGTLQNLDLGTEFSFTMWVYPTDLATHWQQPLRHGDDNWVQLGYSYCYFKSGAVQFNYNGVAANAWTHIACVRQSSGTAYIYINGGSSPTTGANNPYTGAGNDFLIGGGSYVGILDDVRVYSRALTLTEIQNIMNGN